MIISSSLHFKLLVLLSFYLSCLQEFISGHQESVTSSYGQIDSGLRSSYSQLGSTSYAPTSSMSAQPYGGSYGSSSGLGSYSSFRLWLSNLMTCRNWMYLDFFAYNFVYFETMSCRNVISVKFYQFPSFSTHIYKLGLWHIIYQKQKEKTKKRCISRVILLSIRWLKNSEKAY